MKRKYNLSKFVKAMEKEGYTALFHGLSLRKAYSKTEVVKSALKEIEQPYNLRGNKVVDSLVEKGFFVEPGHDEQKFDELKYNVGKISISNIRMLVSNDCNYACRYCQIEENMEQEQRKHNMSIETARKALDLFEKNSCLLYTSPSPRD